MQRSVGQEQAEETTANEQDSDGEDGEGAVGVDKIAKHDVTDDGTKSGRDEGDSHRSAAQAGREQLDTKENKDFILL